ncbi:MAG: hypothetical protein ACC707_14670, partial [Thiohalomonadales bacterium]
PDTSRLDETVGYVVIEAGLQSLGGQTLLAGLGADIVEGVTKAAPYSYSLSGLSTASTAVVSQVAMDGTDGSWGLLTGATPVSATTLGVAVDEDQLGDAERAHVTEQVAYLVFQ